MKVRSEATNRVLAAILTTMTRNPGYWRACMSSRTKGDPKQSGSFFDLTGTALVEALVKAVWFPCINTDGAIQAPAVGFVTGSVPGFVDATSLTDLVPYMAVRVVRSGKDPAMAEVHIPRSSLGVGETLSSTQLTTILLGPDDEMGEIVWSFFPGTALPPSTVAWREEWAGDVRGAMTTEAAIALGFKVGKYVTE